MGNNDTITIKTPWKIISFILLIVIIGLIYINFFYDNSTNNNPQPTINIPNEVDGVTAGQKAAAFLNSRSAEDITYVSSTDLGSIYEITISYKDETLPVYMTKDGKYFIQTAIPVSDNPLA